MIGMVGDAVVLVGLAAAAAGTVTGFAAGATGSLDLLRHAQRFARAYSVAMIAACLVMVYALVTHDFSVKYVSKVGSLSTPLHITIVSLWSSLEGSILLWGAVLGAYIAAFVSWSRDRDVEETPWALGTMCLVGGFFAYLIAHPANPFTPAPVPVPGDGPGPNPLLQNHLLMIIHPPSLYLGYVGMVVPFGMAIGSLVTGKLGPAWTRALRTALMWPWFFLTGGIVLGGWWAYEVLGWGGYWAWDPVENASLLPWLTATAALHAAMLPSRRGSLKGWTVTLVLVTFLLTLLGTFMTRSGVFNSVHAFTQSSIGPIFLGFLGVSLVACVILLAARIDLLSTEGDPPALVSREAGFLVNNVLFVALTFTVLLGTTFPLVMEAVKGVKLSVGEPYFNQVAIPAGIAILFLMGVGPALPWGEPSPGSAWRELRWPGVAAVLAAGGVIVGGVDQALSWTTLCVVVGTFAMGVTIREATRPVRVRMRENGEPLGTAAWRAFSRGNRRLGGYIVHAGIVVIVVAVAVSHAFRVERELNIKAGESVAFEEYTLTLVGRDDVTEPHRVREIARVEVTGPDGRFELAPALNRYGFSMNPIGTPDVHNTLTHDLYLSLLTLGADGKTAGIHVYRNPGILWLWVGWAIVSLGALVALLPSRAGKAAAKPVEQAAK